MQLRPLRPNDARYRLSRLQCWTIAIAVGVALGCGDSGHETSGSGGGGGTSGASGASGASAGASGGGTGGAGAGTPGDGGPRDGPAPPAAQGTVSLHVTEHDDTTIRCSPGRQWVNAPSQPGLIQTQQTSGAEIGMRAVDGGGGARVTCSVRKSGEKYDFVADITTPRTNGTAMLHPTVLHFEASGIARSGPAALGTVTAMTDTTHANFADDQCTFSVTPQGGATGLDVDSGKIWASIACERLAHPTDADDVCRIDVGFAVFENCAQ